MKRFFIFNVLLVCLLSAGFVSCNDDDDDDTPALGATVKVNVDNILGLDKEGVTVYMFKNQEVTSSTNKSDADKSVVTDKNGLAEFNLNFTDLNILESQTNLYFAIFYTIAGEDYVAASTGITIKRNKTKTVELRVL